MAKKRYQKQNITNNSVGYPYTENRQGSSVGLRGSVINMPDELGQQSNDQRNIGNTAPNKTDIVLESTRNRVAYSNTDFRGGVLHESDSTFNHSYSQEQYYSQESIQSTIPIKSNDYNQDMNIINTLKNGCRRVVGQFRDDSSDTQTVCVKNPQIADYGKTPDDDKDYINEERVRREQERINHVERERRDRIERERKERELQERKKNEIALFDAATTIDVALNSETYFCLFTEKKEGLGEDAMPLIYSSRSTNYVGVFDGMGGSGATEYPTYTQGDKTGAYLSSRVIRAICYQWLIKYNEIRDIEELQKCIASDLTKFLDFWNIRPSGLRSSVIRILPTTLALVEAKKVGNKIKVTSYWAGDSRNYVLTPMGLKQISNDDLRQPKDPLENLRNDDALSNCICQDKPFYINEQYCGEYSEPIIILSATDGCFGYLPTPMHFEFILLKTLSDSNSCDEWCHNIKKHLEPISGDDFTIALQMIGEDFLYWKDKLIGRYYFIKEHLIDPIDAKKQEYNDAIQLCKTLEEDLHSSITNLWNEYKQEFMYTNNYHQ